MSGIRSATVGAALITAAALTMTACGNTGGQPAQSKTRSVELSSGTVEVPTNPQRIAVLWRPGLAAATEFGIDPVAALGAPGGDHGLAPYLPEGYPIDDLTIVSNSARENDLNLEELATAAPDLIIGVDSTAGTQAGMRDRLEEIAPTVLVEWTSPTDWQRYLSDVGAVLGAEKQAEAALADYEQRVQEVRSELGETGDTSVSLVRLQDESEVRFETATSFPGEIVADLGFARPESQSGSDPEEPFVSKSYENLSEGDADAMFVFANQQYEDAPTSFDSGVWANLDAVENKKVFAVDKAYWNSGSHYGAMQVLDDISAAFSGELEPAV